MEARGASIKEGAPPVAIDRRRLAGRRFPVSGFDARERRRAARREYSAIPAPRTRYRDLGAAAEDACQIEQHQYGTIMNDDDGAPGPILGIVLAVIALAIIAIA
ncbi:MAG TPA: hypothetical protein VLY46_09025 [Usitatibacter sp.]|nr:hypothetical protein [Usitatibacter sp.]